MKVFCIGLSKTGTSTLGRLLQALGLQHRTGPTAYGLLLLHRGRIEEVLQLADQDESFDDFPWPLLYPRLAERYPDAKFILTERADEEVWFASWCRHYDRTGPSIGKRFGFGYGSPYDAPEAHKEFYRRHSADVRSFFADSDRLLTVCWENGSRWQEVADFLGIDAQVRDLEIRNASESKDPRKTLRRLVRERKFDHAEFFCSRMEAQHPGLYEELLQLLAREAEGKRRRRQARQRKRSRRGWLRLLPSANR